jgi:hypothetical protein
MLTISFLKLSCKDSFGSSVDHDVADRPYGINVYDDWLRSTVMVLRSYVN